MRIVLFLHDHESRMSPIYSAVGIIGSFRSRTRMRLHFIALAVTALILTFSTQLAAGDLAFESRPIKTHLLELFTSEGCSSCPPAEAWFSRLRKEPGLWRDFVPVAFHVDYWDHLGWRDPFASKAWTARQYQYSAVWNNGNVYTPGFVLDGREWHNTRPPPAAEDKAGVLKISISNEETVTASFHPDKGDAALFDLHVARLGFGLSTDVKAGENSGRKLLHDFVVLSLATKKLTTVATEVHLLTPSILRPANSREAMVAWVTPAGQVQSTQAVGGWIR